MPSPICFELLKESLQHEKLVCLDLKIKVNNIPKCFSISTILDDVFSFLINIVDATHGLVCAYKIDVDYFAAKGSTGWRVLELVVKHIKSVAPNVVIIFDADPKTYKVSALRYFGVHAVTAKAYGDLRSYKHLLNIKDLGIFFTCRTVNPSPYLDMLRPHPNLTKQSSDADRRFFGQVPAYQCFVHRIATEWNGNRNCAVTVDGVHPGGLRKVRELAGQMPIMVSFDDIELSYLHQMIAAGLNDAATGLIISSNNIIYASHGDDYAHAARLETLLLANLIRSLL